MECINIKALTLLDTTIELQNKKIPRQPKENDEGNKEYKRHLKTNNNNVIDFYNRRASQMKYRLYEGNGKAIYMLGVEDNGSVIGLSLDDMIITITNIKEIAKIIEANIRNIRIYDGDNGLIATVRLHKEDIEFEFII